MKIDVHNKVLEYKYCIILCLHIQVVGMRVTLLERDGDTEI